MNTVETFEGIEVNKKQLTFQNLADIAADIQSNCADYNVLDVTSKDMYYNADTNRLHFRGSLQEGMQMTPFALSQLCSRLEVPVKYVQRCIEEGNPYLAADNINSWIDEYHKNLFVRTYNNTVRGVLSSKYSTFDAPDVISVFRENAKGHAVKGFTINPERLHIRTIQKDMLPIKGEDLFVGFALDSSDVGRSTLVVRVLLYKQVCKNGMCINTDFGIVFMQKHVGLTNSEFHNALQEKVRDLPVVAETITEAVKKLGGYKAAKEWKDTVNYKSWNEETQKNFIQQAKILTKMPDDAIVSLVDLMYEKYTVTPWGFINAMTEKAQDFTLERRLDIERAASTLMFNPQFLFTRR